MTAEIPVWISLLIGVAAALTASGVIWRMAIRPIYRVVKILDDMLPVLFDLTAGLKDNPGVFKVLNDIASQFRTDSGSSLRDVVNRLEVSAVKNRIATEELNVNIEVQRKMGDADRRQVERLMTLLNVVAAKQSSFQAIAQAHAETSHEAQERMIESARLVASDLKETHERADQIEQHADVPPGVAADAAARSKTKEEGD